MKYKIEVASNEAEAVDREEIEALFTNSVRRHASNLRDLRNEEDRDDE